MRKLQSNSDRDATAMQLDAFGRGLTAADIIGKLKDLPDSPPEWMSEMRSAVEELCDRLDGRKLSIHLRSFKRRNFAGMMLDVAGEKNGSKRWLVRRLDTKAKLKTGDAGDKGDVSPRVTTVRSSQPSFGSMEWKSQMLPD